MTRDEELADLRAKLRSRENQPGYKANVAAIRARIAELEADNAR